MRVMRVAKVKEDVFQRKSKVHRMGFNILILKLVITLYATNGVLSSVELTRSTKVRY